MALAQTVEVREKPILFSGPMVKAILEGRKTQTRRVIKPQPDYFEVMGQPISWDKGALNPPYGKIGDRLWVRETFANLPYLHPLPHHKISYRADGEIQMFGSEKWKPSIFMPRWASRITLEVTGVRVERLQDISEEDAIAEGAPVEDFYGEWLVPDPMPQKPSQWYRDLWDKINAKKCPWSSNPWVWVISFKRLEPVLAESEGV
jgi:hypothetical protein